MVMRCQRHEGLECSVTNIGQTHQGRDLRLFEVGMKNL